MPSIARRLLLLCLLLCAAPAAHAQEREPGAELTVYVATMGPGDQVWEKFGHNAIWIRDALTGTTIAYNYGIFDFAQERFIPRLMKGEMLYSMGVEDAERELAAYSYFNRSVTLQRLNLTPAQRHSLREFLEWNWLPQNRDYRYDYFRDNCSTRIRDALDRALGGVLSRSLRGVPTGTTFQWHSLRLTAASPAVFTGLMIGLGINANRAIDAWEEGFVPMELARHLRTIEVVDAEGRSVPLVAEEIPANSVDRAPPATEPPSRVAIYLVIGLVIAAILVLIAWRGRNSRVARAGLGLAIFFWGIATGFFGVLLALLWLFTEHIAAYPNVNLLHLNPLGLLLAIAAPLAVVGTRASRVARMAWPLAIALAAMSVIGLLLHTLPSLRQMNGALVALLLPVHFAVVIALYYVRRPDSSHEEDVPARVATPAAA